MEQIKLEKIYKISNNMFREGFTAYQKKFVYPKNYLFMAVFFVLALNFVYGAVKAPENYFAYIMIAVCLALMVKEWVNPRKMRRAVIDTIRDIGEQEYKITVGDGWVEFSTSEQENVENLVENENATEFSTIQREDVENEPVPPTRIENDRLKILEYDRFFLLADGKIMFYIVPKDDFSQAEIEIIRNIDKN